MEAATAAISRHTSKRGHFTNVDEVVRPAITLETVKPHRHEVITEAIDKEVHQHHHHTTVVPLTHKETLPTRHTHNLVPVKKVHHQHENPAETERALAELASHFRDTLTTLPVTHTKSQAPQVVGEHYHHHVHEIVQPVIYKETIQQEHVHTTIPIHEVHHVVAKHHGLSALPIKPMEEFLKFNAGRKSDHVTQSTFEGAPRPYDSKLATTFEKLGFHHNPAGHHGMNNRDERGLNQAGTNGLNQPGMNGLNNTNNHGLNHRNSNGINQPGVLGMNQHGTHGLGHTDANGMNQAGVRGMNEPGVLGMGQTGTHGLNQPGTHGLGHSNTHGMNQPGVLGMNQSGTNGLNNTRGINETGTHGLGHLNTHGMNQSGAQGMNPLGAHGTTDNSRLPAAINTNTTPPNERLLQRKPTPPRTPMLQQHNKTHRRSHNRDTMSPVSRGSFSSMSSTSSVASSAPSTPNSPRYRHTIGGPNTTTTIVSSTPIQSNTSGPVSSLSTTQGPISTSVNSATNQRTRFADNDSTLGNNNSILGNNNSTFAKNNSILGNNNSTLPNKSINANEPIQVVGADESPRTSNDNSYPTRQRGSFMSRFSGSGQRTSTGNSRRF